MRIKRTLRRVAARVARQLKQPRKDLSDARTARRLTGKSLWAQLSEIVALRRVHLLAGDYYEFCLYDDARFTSEQKREFVGLRFQRTIYRRVNDPGLVARSDIHGSWHGMVDKALFEIMMRAAEVPCPETFAVYDPVDGAPFPLTAVGDDELEAVLRMRASTGGFFAKPARAHSGMGAFAVAAIEGDTVSLTSGERLPLDQVVTRFRSLGRSLIQERLRPHHTLEPLFGPTLPTARVVVLRGSTASEIHRVALRIPVGANMVDNIGAGYNGNLTAALDQSTGEIRRAYVGYGVAQQRVDRHPVSGALLEGLVLPDWPEALNLARRASRVLGGMPLQSWDLGFTDNGPVMVEVNDMSGHPTQIAGPPGLLDRRLCAFLRERGITWRYPHPR